MEQVKPRPPYVTFEKKTEEDREGYATGQPMKYRDIDYAYITPIGSKDRIERNVKEWFEQLKGQISQGRFEQSWLDAYKTAYQAWLTDQEPPVNGTSLKVWPVLTPAQVKSLTALRILAIEDLAEANEETLQRIGMGSRNLKLQAQEWLKSQSKDGMANLVKKVTDLAGQVDRLLARNEELEKANNAYKAEAKANG